MIRSNPQEAALSQRAQQAAETALPQRTQQAAGRLNYHLVWCPKFRRPVLTGDVSDRLVEMLQILVGDIGGYVVNLDVRPDHVHLFGGFPPTVSPQQIVRRLKDTTSNRLRSEFPALRSRLPSLWTRYCYVGTTDTVSTETIRKYIESQEGI